MAWRQYDVRSAGDRFLGIELAAGGELTLTLTAPAAGGAGPLVRDRLRLRAEDVPVLRAVLARALPASAAPCPGRGTGPGEGLVRRFHEGETVARIAARYGRTPDAVRARLRELGHDPARPEYCPAAVAPAG
ncbi:hypothetical protein [Kitasatospora sp. NPDC059571]|uniref:hypothetical protein n=1 Tax=Kitasatospora sp. NPDC059571 TaxID=3346871 RepID=UPI003682EA68